MRAACEKGFTLVELAIALVVIGLIIGGALRGKEMIHGAQITSTIAQIKSYDAAASTFRDSFGALPGDIRKAALRVPECTGICNIDGNENGKIEWTFDTSPSGDDIVEPFNFFPHLQKAGLIGEPFGGNTLSNLMFPPTKAGGTDHKQFSPPVALKSVWALYPIFADAARGLGASFEGLNNIHYYTLFDITAMEAGTMDKKLDNGNGLNGDVVLYLDPAAPSVSQCMDTNGIYLERALPSVRCILWIQAEF